jgi:hypothetical protein
MSITMLVGVHRLELPTAFTRLAEGDGAGPNTEPKTGTHNGQCAYPTPHPTHGKSYIKKLNIWRFFELGSRSGPPTHNDSEQVVQSDSLKDININESPNVCVSGVRL